MKKFTKYIIVAWLLWGCCANANEYTDLQYQMTTRPGASIGGETVELIRDSSTPENPLKQTNFAYIFHVIMERQEPVVELAFTTGFFLPLKKDARIPLIHEIRFNIDGNVITRSIVDAARSSKNQERSGGVFLYNDLGVDEDLIRKIASSQKTIVTYTALTVGGFFGSKDTVLSEITVTQNEKEAMARVLRFYELMKG